MLKNISNSNHTIIGIYYWIVIACHIHADHVPILLLLTSSSCMTPVLSSCMCPVILMQGLHISRGSGLLDHGPPGSVIGIFELATLVLIIPTFLEFVLVLKD